MNRIFLLTAALLIFSYSQAFAIICQGTEPFWVADITNTSIYVDVYGEDLKNIPITSTEAPRGRTEEFEKTYYNNNRPVATVSLDRCNNGMSDLIYRKQVIIYIPTVGNLSGCCGDPINSPDTVDAPSVRAIGP